MTLRRNSLPDRPDATIRDPARLAALHDSGLLDMAAEEAFDRLTRLAAALLQAPMALVILSDDERQFIKSAVGLPEPWASRREYPGNHCIGQLVVASGAPLVIEDARVDPVARHSPIVTNLRVAGYLGVPLASSDGYVLGSFCVVDTAPRTWTEREVQGLTDLAAVATSEIELRRTVEETRRRAEEAEDAEAHTQAAHELRANILERITDGFFALDRAWRFTYVNHLLERTTGYSQDELIGNSIWELFPEAVGTAFEEEYRRAVAEQVAVQFEAYYPPLQTWFSVRAYPSPDGLSVYYQDITEQKWSDDLLVGQAQVLEQIARGYPLTTTLETLTRLTEAQALGVHCSILLVDTDRSHLRTGVSPSLPTTFCEALDGVPIYPYVGPCGLAAYQREQVIVEDIATDDRWAAEFRDLAAQHGLRACWSTPILDYGGEVLGTFAMYYVKPSRPRPVEQKLIETATHLASIAIERDRGETERERLVREAQEAARVREEFLSIASHELRTPLTTVKAYVELMSRLARQSKLDAPAVTEFVGRLEPQVGRLELLVRDLLDISRIQRGRLELHLEPTDLVVVAREVLERSASLREFTAKHTLTLDAPAPVVGHWDSNRLDQVVTNLISNALKYSPDGGEVRVTVRQHGESAELTVLDHGVGIAPEDQARLFEPFARSEAVRTAIGGAGLGLYIVAEMVARHGGTIDVTSTPGEGSTFTVRLPIKAPMVSETVSDGSDPSSLDDHGREKVSYPTRS